MMLAAPDLPRQPDDTKTLYHLEISERARNCLIGERLESVSHIRRVTWFGLRDIRGAGPKTAHEIRSLVPFRLLPGEKPGMKVGGVWRFEREPKPRIRVLAMSRTHRFIGPANPPA